ncbi:MAG: thioredoxin [Natronomonas sp.]|jgi:thioredoxin 1|uniref:Thioredoxin n=1 Tax=Natronomonas salsuginis TaxID=2217661 RepID=A0A4U5JH37_9EURY|nr:MULTISPECIES: thioredoxin [Natronomonas]MDR9381703.1 thioredoxin [Natronomonas sp.]MDR9430364.1 thioredoxin [Natronomonas sp.]TKR28175.1 thioredoxin [Natronomonas salsuginis]
MSSNAEAVPTEPIQLTDADGLDDAVSSYDVVLVDFYADWCGPCRMMEPTIESIANDTDAAVVKVDVDRLQGLASQYGVQGIPTLLLFADGENVERIVGVQSADQLSDLIGGYAA